MKLFKKIFITLMSLVMLFSTCLSLTACGDMKTLEVKVQVYDYEEEEFKDLTLTIELYRHLAPKTVDAIIDAVEDGYYDDAVFYTMSGYSNQIMVGDYKVNADNEIVRNEIRPTIKGEFEKNGVKGSDLISNKGSIGLWRSWYESDGTYTTSSDARDSGSATWYIPTTKIAGYEGWMCVFATIDLENEDNEEALDYIQAAVKSDYFDQYEVYFTGEYDESKGFEQDYGLQYHMVTYADYNDLIETNAISNLFTAEGKQLVKYNPVSIKIAEVETTNQVGAKIVEITVK